MFHQKQTPETRPKRLGPIKTHVEHLKVYLSNAWDVLRRFAAVLLKTSFKISRHRYNAFYDFLIS